MQKGTRCKFTCMAETKRPMGDELAYDYEFNPVYSQDENSENKKFWQYTPSGKIELTCTMKQEFEVGEDYYFDITKAPKE